VAARKGIFARYAEILREKRARPGDDLMSAMVAARVDGRPLSDDEILGYCFLLNAAGNETTRNATTGGVLALIEHPAELARLRAQPSLALRAADEIVRWVSPIIHFCRTATTDTEVGGQPIRAGETLVLFYPSAARDEAVSPTRSTSTSRARPTRTSRLESASTTAWARASRGWSSRRSCASSWAGWSRSSSRARSSGSARR
jgi:cytochrome P450